MIRSLIMGANQKFDYFSSRNHGKPLEGGFFAGVITRTDGNYAVIVSPKANDDTYIWGSNAAGSGLCKSLNDGALNTSIMINLGISGAFPAFEYCNSQTIGGFSDWYLPSRDELELAYRNLKPSNATNSFANRPFSAYTYTDITDISTDTMGINRHSLPIGSGYISLDPLQTLSNDFKETAGIESFLTTSYWSSTDYNGVSVFSQTFYNGAQNVLGKDNTSIRVRPFRSFKI